MFSSIQFDHFIQILEIGNDKMRITHTAITLLINLNYMYAHKAADGRMVCSYTAVVNIILTESTVR